MSDQKQQKEQQERLHRWFGPENNKVSSLSDSSDRVSVTSTTSFSSLSRKYNVHHSPNASVLEVSATSSSINFWGCNEYSSSSSSSSNSHKYRKVTSSSSYSSSKKSIDRKDKNDNSACLLHVHKRRKKENNSSSSSEEMDDAGSPSSDTSEKDDSSSSSLDMPKSGGTEIGPFVPGRKRDSYATSNSSDTSKQDRSETDLKPTREKTKGNNGDENDSESSSFSLSSKIPKLPPLGDYENDINAQSKSKNSSSASLDMKVEPFASSASSPPTNTRDKVNSQLLDVVSNASETYASSSNSAPSDESVQGANDKSQKVMSNALKKSCGYESSSSSAPSDDNPPKNQQPKKKVFESKKSSPNNSCTTSLSTASSSSSAKNDTLLSALNSSIYQDYSHIKQEDISVESVKNKTSTNPKSKKEPPFPQKLHEILSHPDSKDYIAWLPHGRAWKIVDQSGFVEKVIPRFFQHRKIMSFRRQVNKWGFKRVSYGTDEGSYYHELFLRGLPHISAMMHRKQKGKPEESSRSIYSMIRVAPDFYQISEQHPLPPVTGEAESSNVSQKNNIGLQPDDGIQNNSADLPNENSTSSANLIQTRSSIENLLPPFPTHLCNTQQGIHSVLGNNILPGNTVKTSTVPSSLLPTQSSQPNSSHQHIHGLPKTKPQE